MRTSKTLSVTLPPAMLAAAMAMARREHRTMSELVREALRSYEHKNWWEETNAYGKAKAAARGIKESDVEALVADVRRARRVRRPARKKPQQ